ncbi:excinuclease ABC subunit UvrA [Pseudobacteriovorax antillogorgiicola]|uniref:UvrABC system protein A n=1 Tax=Pseudobacteriovorax antillogorgiicola TaxID=1513793 RepID=A0A1Y6BNQ5_9BACT|nr:excinuclease ABC subunit UvrA [Pseudobacteriovorax antillogorgiicola]TCS53853.1 excinuclease ABC subunit A [Pseudobacteriovorax antillogorgiicola]SMF21530.1 excinuclease ABC subunit A [Pseudobacteriovorax antillogorgiicola]
MSPVHIEEIKITRASEHNLKKLNLSIARGQITVITGVSGSGKSSLAFDTILAESNRRFFYTLSHYTRQFLDLGSRPAIGSISGLSPAIALAQNETQPSVRASVGSLTDISELLGVLFARFGEAHCPKHDQPTSGTSLEQIASQILAQHEGKTIGLSSPFVEQKKGSFKKQLQQFSAKGYTRAYIDGELVSLSSTPELDRESKHDIKVIVDYIKVASSKLKRLHKSLETVIQMGDGVGELFLSDQTGAVKSDFSKFSTKNGCPKCGFAWPKLDSRYFSANSLGRCQECDGLGYQETEDEFETVSCAVCRGTGLRRDLESIRFKGKSPLALQRETIHQLYQFFDQCLQESGIENPAFMRIAEEIRDHLNRLDRVGLGYLHLARRIRSLSGGEAQRVRLAGVLAENLRGVLYVLDEPSQGLSDSELNQLWAAIEKLKSQGNTVIIVDHDETIIRRADWIIDLGPEGGARGGQIMAKFKPSSASDFQNDSLTARYLVQTQSQTTTLEKPRKTDGWLRVIKPRVNNLHLDKVNFPLESFTVVSGVSGAGKSSLVIEALYHNIYRYLSDQPLLACEEIQGLDQIEEVILVDRRPIAKSSVSMPATYLDVFTDLRKFYGKLPDAQIYGLQMRDFSLSVDGGRCPECKGRGVLSLSMKFLADARVTCPICQGQRYKPEVLQVEYRGLNLSQVLDLTIDEAIDHFQTFSRITKRLKPAQELGLGYLKLGQPSSSLSGGESQRLKLVPILFRNMSQGSILIMDEPTTGLHFKDVERLLVQCQKLTEKGVTLIVIEHSAAVKSAADWLVELGPGAAAEGGGLVFEGYRPYN